MLICPQCQFENPNANKFCQSCGTSLTQKSCPECSTQVDFDSINCPNCGTVTGTVWLAIVFREQKTGNSGKSEQREPPISTFPEREQEQLAEGVSLATPSVRAYLDQEQRYQLLEPLPSVEATTAEVQMKVLDCQPFQLSPLSVDTEVGDIEVPDRARPYLELQNQFHQSVPAIHDAWQNIDKASGLQEQVLLIADRSDWPELIDLWQDEQTIPEQILHWCLEITELWAGLEPWKCRQSLLELSNLRVDEDGVLGLQRLYGEPAGQALSLKDLGQVWRKLFHESPESKFSPLFQLLDDLEAGNVQMDDLRSHLAKIYNQLQHSDHSTPDSAPPEVPVVATEPELEDITASGDFAEQDTMHLDELEPEERPTSSGDVATIVLPMHLVSLEDVGHTDVGRQRRHNEDYFGVETTIHKLEFPQGRAIQAKGLYILCDGMGGHAGGEVASSMAVKTLQQFFQTQWQQKQLPDANVIREAVRLANQAIYDVNQQDARSGVGRMGTTLVMVLLQDTQAAVAHVGDSRLYRMSRKRGLEQVTVDHEVGQREIARGVAAAIAYARPDAYQLTQALGPRDENFVNPDIQFLDLNEDTLLILVSDGLSDNNLLENHWQTHLGPLLSSGASLERGVRELVDLANQYNGHDNITAVLIRAKIRPNLEQKHL